MEFKKKANGKRVYSLDQKKALLAEAEAPGSSYAEVARKYGMHIQNLRRWKQLLAQGGETALQGGENVVPLSEYQRAQEEIRKLRQTLGKVTQEKEILQDAVDMARKKKWI